MFERDQESGLYLPSRRVLQPRGFNPRIERPRFGALQQMLLSARYRILDSSSNNAIVSELNGARLQTATVKFGTAAIFLDGTDDYLSVAGGGGNNVFTGNFTIEAWIYPTSVPGTIFTINAVGDWSVSGNGCAVATDSVTRPGGNLTYSSAALANAWSHIAVVRNGTTITGYLNGASVGSITDSAQVGNSAYTPGIGLFDTHFGPVRVPFSGYIDEVRVSDSARYTGAFTPSASAFTTDANTKLLLHLDA